MIESMFGSRDQEHLELYAQREAERIEQVPVMNETFRQLRKEVESLLEEHGANRPRSGVEGGLIAAVLYRVFQRFLPYEDRTRKKIDMVLAPDTTRGETEPISVSIKTVGALSPIDAPRIDIKVDDGTRMRLFGERPRRFLLHTSDLGLDKDGVASERYHNIFGESMRDSWALIYLEQAQNYQEIVGRIRARFTASEA